MRQPKREKTVITPAVVDEINKFSDLNITANDLQVSNLSCFSDAGLGVHTCNPLAPLPDGSTSEDDDSVCSLHYICAVHLGARYGIGLSEDEPYDFDKSKAYGKKLGYDQIVKEIREKQKDYILEDVPVKRQKPASVPPVSSLRPAKPVAKVNAKALQALPREPSARTKKLEAAKARAAAHKAKSAAAPVVQLRKAVPDVSQEIEKVEEVKKKRGRPPKNPGQPMVAKPKIKEIEKVEEVKKKRGRPPKNPQLTPTPRSDRPVNAGKRGRPRTREYDPKIHCPAKKPNYWRSAGAVEQWVPDHKLSLTEVRERLLVGGFRAGEGSRMGLLLDAVAAANSVGFDVLKATWEKAGFKTAPLGHILKIAVKVGAFSVKKNGNFALGGH